MAIEKVHPNKGNGGKGTSRWDKRAVVKLQAKKARRRQDKAMCKAA